MTGDERRQFKRVRLLQPIRASVGRRAVYVLDGSPGGFGLLHRGALPPPGSSFRIVLHLAGGPIATECEVVRTAPQVSNGKDEFFRSGVKIIAADDESAEMLRSVFAVADSRASLS